jgi:membrane protein DedA with SNARE-associated domain
MASSASLVGPLLQQVSVVTQNYGVIGLGMGMFFESLGIPFASAVVALTSGTLIAAGKTTFLEALLISTAGLTLGSMVSYYIGFLGGSVGRFFSGSCLREKNNNRYFKYYARWGELTVLVAQLFGTTRTWISLPAGAMKMRLRKFIVYTAIGGAIYCALAIGFSLALAGLLSRAIDTFASITYLSLLLISFVIITFFTVAVLIRRKLFCNTGGEGKSPQ